MINLPLVETFLLTILIVALFACLKAHNWLYNGNTLPPGPLGIPFFGHLLHIVKDPHLKLAKWGKQYGKLYTIRLGLQTTVVVSDPKVMRDIFSHRAATGKFQTDTILLMSRGPYGVLSSEGKAWEETRKFCVRNLRTFGLGNRSVEPIILNEAQAFVDWIKDNRKKSSDGWVVLNDILKVSAINTLWTMVSGERMTLGDSKSHMNRLMHTYEMALQRTVKTGLLFFPSLKYIAPTLSGYKEFDRITAEIHELICKKFDEHRKTIVKGSPRDLIDCYIDHVNNTTDPQSSFYGSLGVTNSVSTVMELFVGGSETTATTINWVFIYLATEQKIQEKLRNEIDEVIGRNREPSVEDKTRMIYMEAFMLEVFRFASIGPIGVIHRTLEDITYEGYTIPKGTALLPNIYGVHYNEAIWEDPETFRPERFLQKGNEKLKDSVVLFQPGKRSCIGERLAKDILFFFLAKVIQNFYILPDPYTSVEEYYKRDVGIVLAGGAHKIIFRNRD